MEWAAARRGVAGDLTLAARLRWPRQVPRRTLFCRTVGTSVTFVRPEPTTHRLEFKDLGRFAGSCTLVCHGQQHRDEQYGGHLSNTARPNAAPQKPRRIRP